MSTISDALKKSKEPCFLVELDFDGDKHRFAERDISVPQGGGNPLLFKGLILNTLSIGAAFDFQNFIYSLPSVSVEIGNAGRFQDLEVRRRPEAGTGAIYIWCPGLDWADIQDDGMLFKGSFVKQAHDKSRYRFQLEDRSHKQFKALPETMISEDRWPNMRTEGGGGSVAGQPQAIVVGDFPKGVPLKCVDTAGYKYLAMEGIAKSADADYTATTENVYDKEGAVIAAAGYTFYPGKLDGRGWPVSYFDFTSDQAANEPLSCSIRGLYDGSGEITGAAAQLIEHPADIVCYLLLRKSNFNTDEIDEEGLKTMRTLLPGLKFATAINAAAEGVDIVDRLLSQCLCARRMRAGKMGVMVLDSEIPAVVRERRDIHFLEGSIRITKTPSDLLCNKLRVQYAYNPSTGQPEKELTRDRQNDSLCKKSYFEYGESPERTLELKDVQDESAAYHIARRHLDLFAFHHDIIECEAPWWDGFDVRRGDVGYLTADEGPSSQGTGWAAEACILLEKEYVRDRIGQRWWRIAT